MRTIVFWRREKNGEISNVKKLYKNEKRHDKLHFLRSILSKQTRLKTLLLGTFPTKNTSKLINQFLCQFFENNFRYFSNVTPRNAWKKSYSPKEFKIPLFVAFSNFWSGQLKLCLRHGIFRE